MALGGQLRLGRPEDKMAWLLVGWGTSAYFGVVHLVPLPLEVFEAGLFDRGSVSWPLILLWLLISR